ncbi:cupin domain-containing protein [Actinomadura sp. HBU206391]|uniref:cupin domain-containing protein n=1 Tax=Actinomadura sp. HBU206391 TaxID=2731692 RepID=UPI0016506ABA|nr:cupin domain-containing protein [Actinomadura sp. HBU206391]MBC6463124.1 cupin domain-containing protein [Actinomadura sp. HBU206391]
MSSTESEQNARSGDEPTDELLPELFTGPPEQPVTRHELRFEELATGGRVGAEIHRLYSIGDGGPAAAIVRYRPGATAKTHLHPSYELIYVLSGALETDDGVYPAGSLLVSPPGAVHAPRSEKGCVALVVWEQPVRPL